MTLANRLTLIGTPLVYWTVAQLPHAVQMACGGLTLVLIFAVVICQSIDTAKGRAPRADGKAQTQDRRDRFGRQMQDDEP